MAFMKATHSREWPPSVVTAAGLVSFAIVGGILYWTQAVLIPVVLATLLTFLLNPVVTRLDRWGIPRIPAVVSVVVVAAIALGALGYVVGIQLRSFASELPQYRDNIRKKITDVRSQFQGGALQELQKTLEEIETELARDEGPGPDPSDQVEEEPVPVELKADGSPLAVDFVTLRPVLGVLATAGLVIVLVIFMLIKREDLRNRMVSLTGQGSVALTTKALDEAGQRISRYLLMQFIINVSFGMAVGVGLFFIGTPYPALWGLCAAVLRYIPYIGPWIAAVLPITVTLVSFPGWMAVLSVVALFVVLELFSNNVMEPWLYGHSVGLSELAIIVAAVFWTWLWGPVGLILSTPMTVCLVVMGKYIPALSFLTRLLSEQPPIAPDVAIYQRLLARDEDEAEEIAEEYIADKPLVEVFDDLLLPVLYQVQHDRIREQISPEDELFVLDAVEDLIEELARAKAAEAQPIPESGAPGVVQPKALVLGFPARARADELALQMLRELTDPRQCDFEILSSEMLISEKMAAIEERQPAGLCLASVPPGDLVQIRQLFKRLRARFPEIRLLVGRLRGKALSDKSRQFLRSAGVERIASDIGEMHQELAPLVQVSQHAGPLRAARPTFSHNPTA